MKNKKRLFVIICLVCLLPMTLVVYALNQQNNKTELLAQNNGAGLWQYYSDCTVYDGTGYYQGYRNVVGNGKLFVRQYNGAIYLQLRFNGQQLEVYSNDDGQYFAGKKGTRNFYWIVF